MTGTTQIEAGRELDALVAVEVMGWTPWLEQRGQYRHIVWQTEPNREPWKSMQDAETQRQRYSEFRVEDFNPQHHIMQRIGDTFCPSTTGNGMLAVLERMRALWWLVSITWSKSNKNKAWLVLFLQAHMGNAQADTLPHAVCLAALEAVRA